LKGLRLAAILALASLVSGCGHSTAIDGGTDVAQTPPCEEDLAPHPEDMRGADLEPEPPCYLFQPPTTMPLGFQEGFLFAADFDRDGNLDIATQSRVSDFETALIVLWGDGHGSFPTRSTISDVKNEEEVIEDVADVDGDGWPDLVTQRFTSFLNKHDRTFQRVRPRAVTYLASSMVVEDLNHDGIPDVVVWPSGGPDPRPVSSYLGKGDGTFDFFWQSADTWQVADPMVGADVNCDGNFDLVLQARAEAQVVVMLGDGHGRFVRSGAYDFLGSTMFVADVTDDGIPDLLLGYGGGVECPMGSLVVAPGVRPAGFSTGSAFPTGGAAVVTRLADLTLDGRLDAISVDDCTNQVTVTPGLGGGAFGPPTACQNGVNPPRDVVVGDFNNDGRPDLVTANMNNTLSIWLHR
jgi:hypothetical protein